MPAVSAKSSVTNTEQFRTTPRKPYIMRKSFHSIVSYTPQKPLEEKMNQEQTTIGYDDYMPQPLRERRRVFSEISPENRALLVRTHVERWLTTNRPRLTGEQIAVVEEMILYITSERYQPDRDMEKIHQEAEALLRKAETVLSGDDVRQIVFERADYVPPVGSQNG